MAIFMLFMGFSEKAEEHIFQSMLKYSFKRLNPRAPKPGLAFFEASFLSRCLSSEVISSCRALNLNKISFKLHL